MSSGRLFLALAGLWALLSGSGVAAQEPVSWGVGPETEFSTFSIVAIDPETGESGVAVTTRVACVGNGVPWVRAGVGAVATQASTRVEYGEELLDLLEAGTEPDEALARLLAEDGGSARRQVGVIALDGASAQHTGASTTAWAGHRHGANYATQGNMLVGAEVLAAVAGAFESAEESGRHLGDRLVEALEAGQAAGGDARKGRLQSAAVVVVDPRPGRARRPDGQTVNINVCEHLTAVAELRRIYNSVSQTLGYRTLQEQQGNDVWQLKIILHALGYYRPESPELERDGSSGLYTLEAIEAADRFRADQGLSTAALGSPRGLADEDTVRRLWTALEARGLADEVRRKLRDVTAIRR